MSNVYHMGLLTSALCSVALCLDINTTVVLVAVFLHKAPLPAYQRGFFCGDTTIGQPYKNSTVPTLVLIGVGFAVPVVSVSPG